MASPCKSSWLQSVNVPGPVVPSGKPTFSVLNFMIRLFKAVAPTHALYGGSFFLSYTLIMEFARHHDHTNLRPVFLDHLGTVTLLSGVATLAVSSGTP
jgi:hypothetical protein